MEAITRALRRPGAMLDTLDAAPCRLPDKELVCVLPETPELVRNSPGYEPPVKPRLLDRILDSVVRASGSTVAFCLIQLGLWAWVFSGIALSQNELWPVIISDVQAIFSYGFDSLLMRQQLNGYYESLRIAAQIRSRNLTHRRLLAQVLESMDADNVKHVTVSLKSDAVHGIDLPVQSRFDRAIDLIARVIGHVGFVAIFWVSMFVWLGFGPANQWSNQWQLDINSATSALMIFIFSFLAILRERHSDYTRAYLDTIYRLDSAIELRLRLLTNDQTDHMEVHIPAPKVNTVQRVINYYADIVGTLVGIALLIIVIIIWIALGPTLEFSANWWLVIGTYSGLVGLNDGFVMRNVQAKLRDHEAPQYSEIDTGDCALVALLEIPPETTDPVDTTQISYRISERMNKICGHELMVVLGFLLICGLLVGSSVMGWSETGQLLSNVPPSIIESFFMDILITGHNAADAQRRKDLTNMFQRRLQVLGFLDAMKVSDEKSKAFE